MTPRMKTKSGIMIIGPSGSGKTTLGRRAAELIGLPFIDVDEYIWRFDTEKPYTEMYCRAERVSRIMEAIAPHEHFVMAGSMSTFHAVFDPYFKLMVFLYAEPKLRRERLIRRSEERFGERVLEGGDLFESNNAFIDSNRLYEGEARPCLREQREWMESLGCAKLELDGKESVEKNARLIAEAWAGSKEAEA